MVREEPAALNSENRIDELLREATAQLADASDSPRLDAELLLARAIDVSRSYLFAHPDDRLDDAAANRFRQSVETRAGGMPIAYITGEKEFWSMVLLVGPGVLIPRPETEIVVEQALMRIPRKAAQRILDLGTGSGAIALALARERPLCDIVATDLSAQALRIAAENARQLGIPNIEFVQCDWLSSFGPNSFDVIVSNPPYVAAGDPHLDALYHEPAAALVAGEDGLDAIRVIAAEAGARVKPGGILLLEHGAGQADAVAALLDDAGWRDISKAGDLAGLPRVTMAARS